jgi:hypothetical protein
MNFQPNPNRIGEAFTASDVDAIASTIIALLAGPADRAYRSGVLLARILDEGLHRLSGHDTFDAWFKDHGLKRAAVYSNIQVAKTFLPEHLAFGISKLRVLAQAKVADPRALLAEGIPVAGGASRSVEDFSYRELAAWVKSLPEAPKAPSPVAAATFAAAAGLIGQAIESEQAAA